MKTSSNEVFIYSESELHYQQYIFKVSYNEEGVFVISVLSMENNEFISMGSYIKESDVNIERFLNLITENSAILFSTQIESQMQSLYKAALKEGIFNNIFSDFYLNNQNTCVFKSLDCLGFCEDYNVIGEYDVQNSLELKNITDYIKYLEIRFLLNYFDVGSYKEKLNLFYSKLQDEKYEKKVYIEEAIKYVTTKM